MMALRRTLVTVALLAVGVWQGGLLALGAVAAPVVFSVVPLPTSADAMTVVFRRFDRVAMACAATLLACEAGRALMRDASARLDHVRTGVAVFAAAAAVYQGTSISPRIVELHTTGVFRGVGSAGEELSRLHDLAERVAMAQLLALVVVVALYVIALSRPRSQKKIARAAGV